MTKTQASDRAARAAKGIWSALDRYKSHEDLAQWIDEIMNPKGAIEQISLAIESLETARTMAMREMYVEAANYVEAASVQCEAASNYLDAEQT